MAIELKKGERVSLDNTLNNLTIGLGWDPNDGTGDDFDLDASAFMTGSKGKIPNDDYFVFYNSENRVLPDNLNKLEPYDSKKYPRIQEDYKEKTRGGYPLTGVFTVR
jgi:hypothetical protein